MMQETFEGTVVKATGSWYDVRDEGSGEILQCRVRGRLRLRGVRSTSPVVIGDRVRGRCDATGQMLIEEIEPRRNYVIRRASNLSKESHIIAANIDRALLVVTLFSPATNFEFIDRFLVTCEAYRIPVTIILNKIDMARSEPEQLGRFEEVYALAGYRVVECSAVGGEGMETVAELLSSGVTLISGNSGVGKSTLIRAVAPDLDIRTGEVSAAHHKGRHTTTFSQMYLLPSGGAVIDTPGIKGFGLIDIEEEELAHYFPEMMRVAPGCQYYNCTHTHEPNCAVVEAVRRGEIALERYESYLKIMDEDEKYRK